MWKVFAQTSETPSFKNNSHFFWGCAFTLYISINLPYGQERKALPHGVDLPNLSTLPKSKQRRKSRQPTGSLSGHVICPCPSFSCASPPWLKKRHMRGKDDNELRSGRGIRNDAASDARGMDWTGTAQGGGVVQRNHLEGAKAGASGDRLPLVGEDQGRRHSMRAWLLGNTK